MKNLCTSVLSLMCFLFACSEPNSDYITVRYDPDLDEFINPERGFYRPFGSRASTFKSLDKEKLLELRNPQPAAGGFDVASSLTYRSYQFDIFKDKPISPEMLDNIQADFDIIREVGNKVILRFSYTAHCCDPPFDDAPKEIILQHLEQLKSILKQNKDIIAVVQMGLIGPWGEQFYSDHFGDLEHGPVTEQHWLDRNEVIDSLLSAVPQSRMIQVRAPYYKLRYLNGSRAHPETAAPLTVTEAFNGTPIARLAHHNDCILANYDDYWTYHSFHQWPPKSDTLHLKPYVASETKYLVFGGETCPGGENGEDVYNPYNNCLTDGGTAEHYLKRFHTSFLNTSWAGKINGDWNNKCIDEIKRNLGYRFELMHGEYPNVLRKGENVRIHMEFINKGYAAPYNPRLIELILRNKKNQKVYKFNIGNDPRFWLPGEVHEISVELQWSNDFANDEYEIFVSLPDPEPSLYDRQEYSIRLASQYENESLWDASTGWNRLFHSIKIE